MGLPEFLHELICLLDIIFLSVVTKLKGRYFLVIYVRVEM
jgi:hypothetical protein